MGDDPACLLSALAAASHQDMSAGVIIQEWVFLEETTVLRPEEQLGAEGEKQQLMLFSSPPKKTSAIVVPANKLSGEQKVLGVR